MHAAPIHVNYSTKYIFDPIRSYISRKGLVFIVLCAKWVRCPRGLANRPFNVSRAGKGRRWLQPDETSIYG